MSELKDAIAKQSVTKVPMTGSQCPKKSALIDELIKNTEPEKPKDPKEGRAASHGRQ